jgi:hypothetical protein
MSGGFKQALEKNAVPRRLGDVALHYETTMLVGRADKPPRGLFATIGLLAGIAFGLAAVAALLTREDSETVIAFVVPAVASFVAAAWFEQRDRRQRGFAVEFVAQLLRLDFSTPLSGMPRTLKIPFEQVRDVALEPIGGERVLTIDFTRGEGLYREVLVASVPPAQLSEAERLRKMLRAAIGLDAPVEPKPEPATTEPPPPIDSFS